MVKRATSTSTSAPRKAPIVARPRLLSHVPASIVLTLAMNSRALANQRFLDAEQDPMVYGIVLSIKQSGLLGD